MKIFAVTPLLALLIAPWGAQAQPQENAEDELQPREMAVPVLPSMELMEAWERGGARGARLGVSLGGWAAGAVEGLNVMSISPAGPAETAGLRSGDMLTAFNGEPLAAESGQESYEMLLELLAGVEPGDDVTVTYWRGEEEFQATIVTGAWDQLAAPRNGPWRRRITEQAEEWARNMSNWSGGTGDVEVQVDLEREGEGAGARRIVRIRRGPANPMAFWDMAWRLGGLEITELTPALGKYFGADYGLLVVKAPDDEDVALEEGDVIRKIGGREFKDVRHATRILRSYEPKETVELEVLRHKRTKTVSFKLPERARGPEAPGRGIFIAPVPVVPVTPATPPESPPESS